MDLNLRKITEQYALFFILGLAFFLRLITINQSFWLDEAISAVTAGKPFPYQITGLSGDFQPPLYYLILKAVSFPGIRAEWIYRLPSVLFGVIAIYFIFRAAEKTSGRKAAVYSALITATSQFLVYYSQEARMYSLLFLISSVFIWSFVAGKNKLTFISGVLGIYTNYIFFFTLPVPFIISLVSGNRNDVKKQLFILSGILIAFIPWVPQFLAQLKFSTSLLSMLPGWGKLMEAHPFGLALSLFVKFTLGRLVISDAFYYTSAAAALAIFYLFLFKPLIKPDGEDKKLIIWLALPFFLVSIFSFFKPVAGYWRLIFLQTPFIMLTGRMLSKLKYPIPFLFVIICINLLSNAYYFSNNINQREDWRSAVSFTDGLESPVIFVAGPFDPYLWYSQSRSKICSPQNARDCLSEGRVLYYSYLNDLYQREGQIKDTLSSYGYKESDLLNFRGVGFVYIYENRN